MKGAKNLETESECSYEEDTYANMGEEIPAAKNTQLRMILILGVPLILLFITLVILTTFRFISYKRVGEEMSQMRNGFLSSEVQSIRGAVRSLEQVQTGINSNMNYNLTDEVTGSSNPLCSEGWTHYALSCYYFSSDLKPWNASKKDCENKEAHLIVINSEDEMNFLRSFAKDFTKGKSLWIGLTDQDGTWRWVDGTPYDTTPKFWGQGQPDDSKGHKNEGGEDCAVLTPPPRNDWNDAHCSPNFPYVCEKKMIF